MSKIFIIGLPRTGTTSLCAWFLQQGYKTAHTAFTQQTFQLAEVVADAPVFCDYPHLDRIFPNSKFILLQRDLEQWLPSMHRFMLKAIDKFDSSARGFNPVLSRAYKSVFDIAGGDVGKITHQHLGRCMNQHRLSIESYFVNRPEDLLVVDLSHSNALERLCHFLDIPLLQACVIPKLNINGQVIAWDKIKDKNKIPSNAFGPERRKYFDFAS